MSQSAKPKKMLGQRFLELILCTIGALVVGVFAGFLIVRFTPSKAEPETQEAYSVTDNGYSGNSTQKLLGPVVLDEKIRETAENTQHAVVTILTRVVDYTVFGLNEGMAIGSGVVYEMNDSDVYIITNAHVIEDASEIYLYFLDEDPIIAEIQGTDPDEDLAVLRVSKQNIPQNIMEDLAVITWADSDEVRAGDTCIAVGCPYDMEYEDSVSMGIVSGTQREISYNGRTVTVMQTDAAINPGNSGGAMVNTDGALIGINSAKIKMDSVEGMGFFIPSNTVKPIVESIVKSGSIDRPTLGIASYGLLSENMADIYGVPAGLIVYELRKGSAGEKAGLEEGDIITAMDGVLILELEDVDQILEQYDVGDTVELTVVRDRNATQTLTLSLTLASSLAQETGEMPGSFLGD